MRYFAIHEMLRHSWDALRFVGYFAIREIFGGTPLTAGMKSGLLSEMKAYQNLEKSAVPYTMQYRYILAFILAQSVLDIFIGQDGSNAEKGSGVLTLLTDDNTPLPSSAEYLPFRITVRLFPDSGLQLCIFLYRHGKTAFTQKFCIHNMAVIHSLHDIRYF